MDPYHAPLDDGDVAVFDLRHFSGGALGLQRAGLGWLLGMGPSGEREPDAVADGYGVSALGDDAGEARDDEELERVAHLLDLFADDPGHAADSRRHGEFGACLCVFNIGEWFYGFILIVLAVCLFTFFKQRDHLVRENRLESLVSRESSFLFNNMVLLAACFTVLWGTLFPVLSEYVQGTKITVSAPFYNRVNIPIGLFLLFLTGLGPLLAWRSTSLRSIRRNFILPGIAMGVAMVVLMIGGVRPWCGGETIGRGRSFRW